VDAGFLFLDPRDLKVMVSILVNGESKEVESNTTVSDLLKTLQMNPKFLAVELNQKVVPRAEHDRTRVSDHDKIEIVTLVGGG
jgi:thiamine biosynthesis protein ThiS